MSTVIELHDITKTYDIGDHHIEVLKGIDFSAEKGELLSIVGASGSGKSTLMNIIGLLDRHNEGTYLLNGHHITEYNDEELARIRNEMIGFVFQSFFLLPKLTAIQNVSLPLLYRGIKGREGRERCMEMLDKVGMAEYHGHRPSELSGGQCQRVAIARALVGQPSVVLADEPTGALDSKIGQEVMELFLNLNHEAGVTLIIITHDPKVAAQCQRVVRVKDGNVVSDDEQ